MNIELLKQLKQEGFKYLFRRHEENSFKPLKHMPEKISDTPLLEDELIPIEVVIEFVDSIALKNSQIILK